MSEELNKSEQLTPVKILAGEIIEKIKSSLNPELQKDLLDNELYADFEKEVIDFLNSIPKDKLMYSFFVNRHQETNYLVAIKARDKSAQASLFRSVGGNEALTVFISDLVLKHFEKPTL